MSLLVAVVVVVFVFVRIKCAHTQLPEASGPANVMRRLTNVNFTREAEAATEAEREGERERESNSDARKFGRANCWWWRRMPTIALHGGSRCRIRFGFCGGGGRRRRRDRNHPKWATA